MRRRGDGTALVLPGTTAVRADKRRMVRARVDKLLYDLH
jgi:hypothetical protein